LFLHREKSIVFEQSLTTIKIKALTHVAKLFGLVTGQTGPDGGLFGISATIRFSKKFAVFLIGLLHNRPIVLKAGKIFTPGPFFRRQTGLSR